MYTPQTIENLLLRTLRIVLPGDGTITLDRINTLLQDLGSKTTLPQVDALLAKIPDLGMISGDSIRDMIHTMAATDPTEMIRQLVESMQRIDHYVPPAMLERSKEILNQYVMGIAANKLNVNLYWNLFLYTSMYYFITYTSPGLKYGKRLVFRLCGLFPAVWLSLSYLFTNVGGSISGFDMPIWFRGLLANVKPGVMMVFFLIVAYQKYQQTEYT